MRSRYSTSEKLAVRLREKLAVLSFKEEEQRKKSGRERTRSCADETFADLAAEVKFWHRSYVHSLSLSV